MDNQVSTQAAELYHAVVKHKLDRLVDRSFEGTEAGFSFDVPHAAILFVHDGLKCSRIIDDCLRIQNATPIHLLIFEEEWKKYQAFAKKATGKTPKWTAGKIKFVANPSRLQKSPGASSIKDAYACAAWLETIVFARDEGLDWFFMLEWDCYFTSAGWLDVVWQEHADYCQGTVCSGTPCVWDANNYGRHSEEFYSTVLGFSLHAKKISGIPCVMKTVGPAHPPRVYPNGALAWYRTDVVLDAFSHGVQIIDDGVHSKLFNERLQIHANTILGYDYYFGAWLASKYGVEVTRKIGILTGSYSGWENEMHDEASRVSMVKTGWKVVMHQYKH